jgi:putative DNA primase/helicase
MTTTAEYEAMAVLLDIAREKKRIEPAPCNLDRLTRDQKNNVGHQRGEITPSNTLTQSFKDEGVISSPPGADWPVLNPIPDSLDGKPDAFPFMALGPILGCAAQAIAEDIQAPDSIAGGSVLAAASLAVQSLANVMLPHGQRSPLSAFVLTGATSGDRKSAVDAVACNQIEKVRKEQARSYAKQVDSYESEMASRKKNEPEPSKPTPKSLTTGNATIEGLSRLLKHQSHVGVFSAEGGEMLGGHSLRDDKRSSGLAFYLKLWSGESIDSLRGGDGLTVLLNRRGAMHVLVQPVLLGQLLTDPLAQGQGLLARCLIAQPYSLAGYRPYQHRDPNHNPSVMAYNRRIEELLETSPTLWPNGDGYELKPKDLAFTDVAMALWVSFYNQTEAMQAAGGELEGARPFASKAAEHAARIAGIITMIEDPTARFIDSDAMDGAIQITGFYMGEHIRLTGVGRTELVNQNLRLLQEWLHKSGPLVPKNKILQQTPRQIRALKAHGIGAILNELATRGYIREVGNQWEVRNV